MGIFDLHRRGRTVLGLDAGDGYTAFKVVDSLGKGVLNAFVPGVGDAVSKYTNQAADWGKQKYGSQPAASTQHTVSAATASRARAALKHSPRHAPAKPQPQVQESLHRDRPSQPTPHWVEPVAVGGALAVALGIALTLAKRK